MIRNSCICMLLIQSYTSTRNYGTIYMLGNVQSSSKVRSIISELPDTLFTCTSASSCLILPTSSACTQEAKSWSVLAWIQHQIRLPFWRSSFVAHRHTSNTTKLSSSEEYIVIPKFLLCRKVWIAAVWEFLRSSWMSRRVVSGRRSSQMMALHKSGAKGVRSKELFGNRCCSVIVRMMYPSLP